MDYTKSIEKLDILLNTNLFTVKYLIINNLTLQINVLFI